MGRVELGRGAAAIVLATPFDRNNLAGQQRLQVLARLHGDGHHGSDREPSAQHL